ncbi:MAG: hypothetical protein OEM91_10795 [Hyphomicrobiales bacterium]|nr:hypothetical protein [Hyphomicrobiales bacterium]
MSGKPQRKGSVPRVREDAARYQKWVSRVYGLAAFCLLILALGEAFGFASALLRTVTMVGIVLAGTAAWVMQAKRICPNCGELYGYAIRIVNAKICRKCGADFPKWRPGMDEEQDTQ